MPQKSWWENEEEYYNKGGKRKKRDWDAPEYGYGYGSHNYDWNKKSKDEDMWKDYESTKVWRGYDYYKVQHVDYKYVEQMANAFSAKYNVSVEVGNEWSIDLHNKKLTYDPMTLLSYTKSEVICSLLHEIGHLRHTTPSERLQSPYIEKYVKNANETKDLFEDFRVDELMKKSYEGAEEIYQDNKPIIESMAKQYEAGSERMKNYLKHALIDKYRREHGDEVKLTVQQVADLLRALEQETIYDYYAAILRKEYKLVFNGFKNGDFQKMVETTLPFTTNAKQSSSTAEVLDTLDKNVFPVIEELLKNNVTFEKELTKVFGKSITEQALKDLSKLMNSGYSFATESNDGNRGIQMRSKGGMDNKRLPQEWLNGDYNALKESVMASIRELVNKLTFLRRQESVIKYVDQQKRGKLNIKSLYKQRLSSPRLFKQKLETVDTIQSFAFSLVLDISGSMFGEMERITNSVRSLITLAEVFEKMKIPYSITTFGSDAVTIKKFGEKYDSKAKKRIGGIMLKGNGSTNLHYVFERNGVNKFDLHKQPEKNKICVIISDGQIGYDQKGFQHEYMDKYVDKGVKFIGVGLNCGTEIVDLCYGQGLSLGVANAMPQKFSELLKSLIVEKKRAKTYNSSTSV